MANKKARVRYPFSRYFLAGALPSLYRRYVAQCSNGAECDFDCFLVDLAAASDAGLRGRIVLRGLKSYYLEYEARGESDPFGVYLIKENELEV